LRYFGGVVNRSRELYDVKRKIEGMRREEDGKMWEWTKVPLELTG
jgi:hypothetical protein